MTQAKITSYGGGHDGRYNYGCQHWQLEVDGRFIADCAETHMLPVWEKIVRAVTGDETYQAPPEKDTITVGGTVVPGRTWHEEGSVRDRRDSAILGVDR